MGSDPYGPGYHPDATGTRPNLGDVGNGNQFGLDLYALYRAGRVHFPEQAARFSGLASDAQYAGSAITGVQAAAGYRRRWRRTSTSASGCRAITR